MKIRIVILAAFAALLPLTLAHAANDEAKPKKNQNPLARADANKDGVITQEEFSASPQSTKNPEAAAKRFTRLDKNGDGRISADEFKGGAAQGDAKQGKAKQGEGAKKKKKAQ